MSAGLRQHPIMGLAGTVGNRPLAVRQRSLGHACWMKHNSQTSRHPASRRIISSSRLRRSSRPTTVFALHSSTRSIQQPPPFSLFTADTVPAPAGVGAGGAPSESLSAPADSGTVGGCTTAGAGSDGVQPSRVRGAGGL